MPIWGTLKIFRGLDTAFSEIYETMAESSFPGKLVNGVIVLVAVVIAIVTTVGVTALFARLTNVIHDISTVTPLVLLFGLVAAFLPMYRDEGKPRTTRTDSPRSALIRGICARCPTAANFGDWTRLALSSPSQSNTWLITPLEVTPIET